MGVCNSSSPPNPCTPGIFPGMEQQFESFPKEIDDEANSYFQKIYNKTMSIPAVLDMLKRFQDSTVKKERSVLLKILSDTMYIVS